MIWKSDDIAAYGRQLAEQGVHPSTVDGYLHGVIGDARGRLLEERIVRLINERDRPWWIIDARLGDREDDRKGIDAYVTLDVDTVPLQIKASRQRNQKARRSKRRAWAAGACVIVASPEADDATLWGRILGKLILVREKHENTSVSTT